MFDNLRISQNTRPFSCLPLPSLFFFLFTEEIDIQCPARQRWSSPFPRPEKIREKPTGVLEPACTISSISFQLHVQWSHIDGLILATVGSISRYENYKSLLPTSPFPQRTGCWTFTSTPLATEAKWLNGTGARMEIERTSLGAYREALTLVVGSGQRHSEKVSWRNERKLRPK